jgi:hypothetical protein
MILRSFVGRRPLISESDDDHGSGLAAGLEEILQEVTSSFV